MQKTKLNSRGFHWWFIPLIIVVLGVIGFTAWYVWRVNIGVNETTENAGSTSALTPINTPEPEVTSEPTPEPTPTVAPISATGSWTGNVSVEAPAACAGAGGAWQATLVDTNGNITGNYSALYVDYSGPATGTISGGQFTMIITGPSGLDTTFTGTISGDAMSGTFVGTNCLDTGQPMTGSFSGVRD